MNPVTPRSRPGRRAKDGTPIRRIIAWLPDYSWPLKLRCAWIIAVAFTAGAFGETVPLSSLDLSKMKQGWASPGINTSVDGHPITVGGRTFDVGVGTHAISACYIDVKNAARKFTALVGVDDEVKPAKKGPKKGNRSSVEFQVLGDGKVLWSSGVMKNGDAGKNVEVDLGGVGVLGLLVTDAGDGDSEDHADWADARIEMNDGIHPEVIDSPESQSASPGPSASSSASNGNVVPLNSLDIGKIRQTADGKRGARLNQSAGGGKLSIQRHTFDSGIGTEAKSILLVNLSNAARRFTALVGVDDDTNGKGSVEFRILGDGRLLWTSDIMRGGDPAKSVDIDLTGVKVLILFVGDAGDGIDQDHADWVDGEFQLRENTTIQAVTPTARQVWGKLISAAEGGGAQTSTTAPGAGSLWLTSLDLGKIVPNDPKPQINKSSDGAPLAIAGARFSKGVGMHAESILTIDLKKSARLFHAAVGVNDGTRRGSVEFQVLGDGQLLWSSDLMKTGDPAKQADVDVTGISTLTLLVSDGGDGSQDDNADWADARIEYDGEAPQTIDIGR